LSYGSINRLPNTDLLPEKIEKVSHEYAIFKFFRYVFLEDCEGSCTFERSHLLHVVHALIPGFLEPWG
jgi:hypothetical protein